MERGESAEKTAVAAFEELQKVAAFVEDLEKKHVESSSDVHTMPDVGRVRDDAHHRWRASAHNKLATPGDTRGLIEIKHSYTGGLLRSTKCVDDRVPED